MRPTTKSATTKPSQPTDKMNFLAGKDITTATLSGHVIVTSALQAADGTLARGLDLFSETVVYNRATGRMEVPTDGQMLYQDHRAPDKKEAAAPEGPTIGSGRGKTAFKWTKSLVYDQAAKEAVMSGDVEVKHWPDANGGQKFDLSGETLTAYLEPDPAAATKPAKTAANATATATAGAATTKPSSAFAMGEADPGKMRLRRITVRDNVHVASDRMDFDAHELSYDPLAQLLTAFGDEANPVVVYEKKDGSTTTASELQWNTKTDQFKVKKLGAKVRR